MESPLLDLRLVRNLVGPSAFAFFASSLGSSDVAPPATPILSFAVLTMAGAFERQLPVPPSHLRVAFLFGGSSPGAAGVGGPLGARAEGATEWVDWAS